MKLLNFQSVNLRADNDKSSCMMISLFCQYCCNFSSISPKEEPKHLQAHPSLINIYLFSAGLTAVLTAELTVALKHELLLRKETKSGLWIVGLFQENVSEESSVCQPCW